MTEISSPEFNPFAPGFAEDPYPQYAALRDGAPVYRSPIGTWMLTRHEDVSGMLRSDASVDQRILSPDHPLVQFQKQMYGDRSKTRRVGAPSMLDLDPPDHTRLRKLVARAFTPRAVDALRPWITSTIDELLDAVTPGQPFDLVEALAFPLPFTVIAGMLGTPPADQDRIRELSGIVVHELEPIPSPEMGEAIVEANEELAAIAAEMIAWKRENPADDMLTALIRAEDDGDALTDEELISQSMLLYIAGHETTVNLISGGALNLLRHPDQADLLRRDPTLIPNAVEEMLRYDSPAQISRRITIAPVTICGTQIDAGEFVSVSLASANRDERFWGPDADEFKVERENARQHVTFGAGPHHCLGAYLTRLEAAIAFERLLDRFGSLELAGDVTWNGRVNLRGPGRLPVLAR